jgi:hypothetical protein
MESNNLYVTHKVILANLGRVYRSKQFQEMDILEWSQMYMNQYAKDVSVMTHFQEIGLDVPMSGHNKNMVFTPCNIFRLMDVYDSSGRRITYSYNGSYIMLPETNTLDVIYINYFGSVVNEEGVPLVPKQYINAAETFCKINAFEEEVAQGTFSMSMWDLWNQQLTGQTMNARSDFRHMDQRTIDKWNIIKGNMIPIIANVKLSHKYFEDGQPN